MQRIANKMSSTCRKRFPTSSAKWPLAAALAFTLALSSDLIFAQSRKPHASQPVDSDACEQESLPLTVRDGMALVRMSINQRPATFIVDSGGMTIINSDRFVLPVVQQIRTGAVTVAAVEALQTWNVVRVDTLAVGGAELHDSKILSRSLQSLESQLGQELGGIFGNDALRLWDSFSLDYKHKILLLQSARCRQLPSTDSLLRMQRDALRAGQ